MSMDESRPIEIHHSHWRMGSMLILSLGFVVLGLAVAVGKVQGLKAGGFLEFLVYSCILFFSVTSFIIARQWLGGSGPVITLTGTGIRDTRVAAQEIPWTAVRNLAVWAYQRQKNLVFTIDPDVEESLTLTRTARWTREPNRALGVDGLCVTATGLNMDFEDLAHEVAARFQASRKSDLPETGATETGAAKSGALESEAVESGAPELPR